MSFLLRAALVIGALSYFALQRQDGPAPARPQAVAARGLATGMATGFPLGEAMDHLTTGGIDGIGALVNALPPETRESVARAGMDALARHIAGPSAARSSGDTLSASDRQPPWRGPAPH